MWSDNVINASSLFGFFTCVQLELFQIFGVSFISMQVLSSDGYI